MYYVASKFECLTSCRGTLSMGKEESYYMWITPYKTKTEAMAAARYIETNSRACEVKVLNKKEYEKI